MASIPVSVADVLNVVADFVDPETGRGALQQGQIWDAKVAEGQVTLTLGLTSYAAPIAKAACHRLAELVRSRLPQVRSVEVKLAGFTRPPQPLGEIGLTVKSVIAVGSGKGGVGKSTMAASIAFGLRRAGCQVGLMDADVYGPSIPHLLGLQGRPEIANQKLQPIYSDGMPVMSMGFLVPPGEAVVWRGPMLHGAITQFLRDTAWGELDYLVIDMPPGTGDIALTLSQMLPLTGAVVVCTPQDVALLDAVKAIAMFRKVNIPLLGMIENMSGFVCPDNGKRYDIFGSGGAKTRAADLQIPFLGDVPIHMSIRENGDAGNTVANYKDPAVAPYLDTIVERLVQNIADRVASASAPSQLPSL